MAATRDERPAVVAAVLGGARGDLDGCVRSLTSSGLGVQLFDTTVDGRHQRFRSKSVYVERVTWPGSFAEARNEALISMRRRSVGSAVLWVDSDERLVGGWPSEFEAVSSTLPQVAWCPTIHDARFSTSGVGRIHQLEGDSRFTGPVHEYLVDGGGDPLAYRPCSVVLHHEGYEGVDRSERNAPLLQRAIAEDEENPRWRAFQIRDVGGSMSTAEIARALRAQAQLGEFAGTIGGLGSADYTRMIAWHSANHIVQRGGSTLLEPALRRFHSTDLEVQSELLYLRLIASAVVGMLDEQVILESFDLRRASLESAIETPWLDAGIAVSLELAGRKGEAEAYRADSNPYTDVFCSESRLRAEWHPNTKVQTGAFKRARAAQQDKSSA